MNMIETVQHAVLLLFLAGCAFEDIKYRQIRIVIFAAGAAAASVLRFFAGQFSAVQIMICLIPGAVLVLVSAASSQAIGFGDSLIFAVTGLFTGWAGCMMLLFAALGTAVIISAVLILLRKKRWNDRLVFSPFILAGYVFLEVIELCQGLN